MKVSTLSLPVVVIVHGSQEPYAWARVSWDNAFAESSQQCIQVPESVAWPLVANMLNTMFLSSCKHPLTEENLKVLAGKAFRNPNISDFSQLMLNWTTFAKEPLPGRNFTFWEWFYGILKLTREHLKDLWKDGLIMGLVEKLQAQDMLMKRPVGNFLLRFSDSELGGISLCAHKAGAVQGVPVVDHLQPWTSKDFAIRSLADSIKDLGSLVLFLYPDVPKYDVFHKYYTSSNKAQPPANGYVGFGVRVFVPSWSPGGGTLPSDGSYPSTSQSVHDPDRGTSRKTSMEPASCGPDPFDALDWVDDTTLTQHLNMYLFNEPSVAANESSLGSHE